MNVLITVDAVVTMDSGRRVVQGGGIIVKGNRIDRVLTGAELYAMAPFEGEVTHASGCVAIPGFVQTHIHLCQSLFRGLADDLELLDWLKLRIFPFEAAHNSRSMRVSAQAGIAELLRSGTTTIMDMGSIHNEEEVVAAINESGIRAFVGKAMMDENTLYPSFKESTKDALSSTLQQAQQWHNAADGRIRYAVAPRFVLSCTDELLTQAYEMTGDFPGMLFHTHAAENRHEMNSVRQRCGMDNVEFFESLGILRANTCLAHCIWLNDREVDLISKRQAKVVHCPSSNLKLGSGIANVPQLLQRGITVSLGADGAPCNNTLDMFREMRLAALLQKPQHGPRAMEAKTVLEMATLGGAKTLGMDDEIGSIEPGKKADIVLLDLHRVWNQYADPSPEHVYSTIVYSCSPENVRSVMIDGKWVYCEGAQITLDEGAIIGGAREELRRLLGRVR
ncbi:MAG: Cytosine deaminase-like protein [Bacteroidetes bacterium]|nr:Cytosine deaminase-like protein [Bacteroidota bacterium]